MSILRMPLHAEHGPSYARAGALSGAMTVNLLVIGALLLPAAIDQTLQGPRRAPEALTIVERVVEIATTAALPTPAQPQQPVAVPPPPVVQAAAPVLLPIPAVPVATENPPIAVAVASTPSQVDPLDATPPASISTAVDTSALATINAPIPDYPRIAARNGWEGTVLLRIRVDTRGLPISVEIARSSGHRSLDEAARRHVMARWTFRPAQRAGLPVESIGTVPVAFSLGRG